MPGTTKYFIEMHLAADLETPLLVPGLPRLPVSMSSAAVDIYIGWLLPAWPKPKDV